MKLCRFNYFLKENEHVIFFEKCKLKSITSFEMLDTKGILLASNMRLLFCELIGEHPHLLQSYEYKYISTCDIKGSDDDIYLYMKYNGDPVKIMGLEESLYQDLINIISSENVTTY